MYNYIYVCILPHIYTLPSFTSFLFFYHYTYRVFVNLSQFSLSKKQIATNKERERETREREVFVASSFQLKRIREVDRRWVPRRNCVGAIERGHQWASDTCTPSILVFAIHGSVINVTIPPISNVFTLFSFRTFSLNALSVV